MAFGARNPENRSHRSPSKKGSEREGGTHPGSPILRNRVTASPRHRKP